MDEKITQNTDISLDSISVKDLLEAGVHLGHKRERWNPKMKEYIFGERKRIHIIDLEKTLELLKKACEAVRQVASEGGGILFVGTKKQIADIVHEEALRCGAFYVTERWLGGTLTNFVTIRATVMRMKSLEERKEKGEFDSLTKKEMLSIERELVKLRKNLDGIADMDELPKLVYITDIKKEQTAMREASKLNIPIVAIVDTNVDPHPIAYPIPGNDDGIKSVKLITTCIANSVLEGKQAMKKVEARE